MNGELFLNVLVRPFSVAGAALVLFSSLYLLALCMCCSYFGSVVFRCLFTFVVLWLVCLLCLGSTLDLVCSLHVMSLCLRFHKCLHLLLLRFHECCKFQVIHLFRFTFHELLLCSPFLVSPVEIRLMFLGAVI